MLSQEVTGSQVRVGISACLLGDRVRYDSGHKKNQFILSKLSPLVEFVRVCPEVEMGLGTPREPIRLVQQDEGVRLQTSNTGVDLTERMKVYARERVEKLAGLELDGFILKKDSPSCGMERVKVYREDGRNEKVGRGIFAETLMDRMPLLPVEEEGRLCDPVLRENYLQRVFAHHRLQGLFGKSWSVGELVNFHSQEKFLLLSHNERNYRELGRLVARASELPPEEVAEQYQQLFMDGLSAQAGPGRHCNVLFHIFGYFSRSLSSEQKKEVLGVIDDFRRQFVPLVVPLTLLQHYVALFNLEYLGKQSYLSPLPKQLMCRNYSLAI